MSSRYTRYDTSYHRASLLTPTYIKMDLGDVVQQFSPTSLKASKAIQISDVQAVSSYSWIDATVPTITVPGSPGIWTNSNPKRVKQDSGLVFIDQNAYRMGRSRSPLIPIFVAVDSLGVYDFKGLDLISDRNNLRKLFRWATGVADKIDFRIDVELAGTTCLFSRREEKDSEIISGFKGYGHEYEKAATKLPPGCEKATGHHRIISIKFGELKILLRFEVDACTQSADVDDLASAFSNLGVASKTTAEETATTSTTSMGVSVIQTVPRKLVAQSSLIEIKTRASHKALDWEEAYPQLYLSQTAYLYLAKHYRGTFGDVEKVQLTGSSMAVHAQRAQATMGRLEALLKAILAAVWKQGTGVGLSLVCEGGNLALYKRKEGTGKAVGEEILDKFV